MSCRSPESLKYDVDRIEKPLLTRQQLCNLFLHCFIVDLLRQYKNNYCFYQNVIKDTTATIMADTHQFQAAKLFDLKGWVCVVTGGGTGIGLMCTQALAANGPSDSSWACCQDLN